MSFGSAVRGVLPKIRSIPEWGIDSVPQEHRIFGFLDYAVLWGNLGIGLLVMLAGTFLVPGLSLGRALLAILVGNALGCVLLALVGKIGSDTGLPTMVLLRPVLGRRGSYVPTALNVLQLLGWTVFEFIVMGVAADAIGKDLFGVSNYPVWTAVFAAIVILMGIGGPVGVVRQWLEKFAVWVAIATSLWLSYKLVTSYDLATQWSKAGDGSLTFWVAVDLVIALPISWLPLVADYNRFARRPRRAFWGTGLGFFVTSAWFLAMGAVLMLGAGVKQEPKDFTTAIALIAGWVALLILLADETHNAWADLYSTSVSLQNALPKVKQRWFILGLGLVCFGCALLLDVTRYQDFLYLIGSFFIPLFGILVSDYFVGRRRLYHIQAKGPGPGAYGEGFRAAGLAAWLFGILAYHVANPATLGAFIPGWPALVPAALTAIGGSIPSFAVAFIVHTILGSPNWKGNRRDAETQR
jgi:putative hydroxymethylpyrimidine transporter CytX